MKIDRLIIDGFGKLCRKQIRFSRDRVNLLIEENEFGKSTIAEAISACLFGIARGRTTSEKLAGIDAKQPLGGGQYKIAAEISVQSRRFRITRDFESESIQILDIDSGTDITPDFITKKGAPQIGEKLIGLSRDQFQQTCFIGHHSLVHTEAGPDLKRVFEQIASSSHESKTAAQAISALQKGLDRLPGATMGATLKVDTEIRRLQGKIEEIKSTLTTLENNRKLHEADVSKLSALQTAIAARRQQKAELESLRLAAYARELDARVSEQSQVLEDISRLAVERNRLADLEAFPAALNENLVRWNGQLHSRSSDLQSIGKDIANAKDEAEKLTAQIDARFSRIKTFTTNDRDRLVTASEQLSSTRSRRVEAAKSREAELEILKSRGITPARLNDLDSLLSHVNASTREMAVGYPQQRDRHLSELANHERVIKEQSGLIDQIDSLRKGRKTQLVSLLIGAAIFTLVFVVLFLMSSEFRFLWGSLSAIGFISSIALLVMIQGSSVLRSDDRSNAVVTVRQATSDAEAGRSSLRALDNKCDSVAKSAGFGSAMELAKACLEFLTMGDALREFQRLNDELSFLDEQKHTIQGQVLPLLQRAGYPVQIAADIDQRELDQLLNDVEAYFALRTELDDLRNRLTRRENEQQRTQEDVDAISSRLREGFQEAGVKVEGSAFDDAYERFRESLEQHQRFKKLVGEELPRLEGIRVSSEQLLEWKDEQERAHKKLKELGVSVGRAARTQGQYSNELSSVNSELEHLTEEYSITRLAISKAIGDFESQSQSLGEECDELETHLGRVVAYRDAVSFALDKLQLIADDVHREWSESLNGICEEMLPAIKSSYRSIRFADDLSFTLETADSDVLTMRDVTSRLSLGAREQLFLLQRLAVSLFLSNSSIKLPLILDDPLVSSDDERFLGMMRFVIEVLPSEHQVLMFSCHKRRHEWLRDQLGDVFTENVQLVELESI